MIALFGRMLPCFQMRVDVCKDEIYAFFSRLFTNAVKLYELDILGSLLILAPNSIAAQLAVNITLNEWSGTAAAGTEVDESVGLEGGTEDGADFRGEKRGAGSRLDKGDFQYPEEGEGCLNS